MKQFLTFFIGLIFLGPSISLSQTLIGAQIDNRAGIKGLSLNPANVINPRLKSEIHLFSMSAYVGNDYIGLSLGDLDQINNFQRLQSSTNINAKPDNNFVGNLDVFGPGFQFNLDSKNSLALTTRFRTFFNLNNIGGDFFETIVGEDESESFEVVMQDLSGIAHTWGEIGLTYGRVFVENENYSLRGAATVKYLVGGGGAVGSSRVLGAVYLETPNTLTTRGNLNFGYSEGFDSENDFFSELESGFGADLGLIFQVKDQSKNAYTDGYKFKAGISVLDLGGIRYQNFTDWDYDMNQTLFLDQIPDQDLIEFLEENYTGTQQISSPVLGMPTSLQIFADYAITNRFYLSGHGSISIKNNEQFPVSQIVNSFVLTPRLESGWFSLYSPISYRQYEGSISWGVGVRLGPVTLGSGSILTNLLSKNSRSTDAYFGVQIPIYKKGVKTGSNP
ncbi:hypothetical protein Aoki45_28100 [Algoriphagus sp. oki45]|uniref:DUF5723 family protein n=1 Tax=Algoriphagus sp. oki45 TaxID=3067294 RepID=UPI0027EFB1C6|nr:hypothetical protein Aoki45_28100 [Algoriphagus sp. oki45]